jgi:phage baseplate assembly protein W
LRFGNAKYGIDPYGITFSAQAVEGPQILNVVPSLGGTIARTDVLEFDVVSNHAGLIVVISAAFGESPSWQVVYDGAFGPLYLTDDSAVTAISGGYHFSIARSGSWIAGGLILRVTALDGEGNLLRSSLGWTVEEQAEVAAAAVATGRADFQPYGYGLLLPFRRTSSNDFLAGGGEALIRAAVRQILGTVRGELPWRPRFGAGLWNLRHLRNSEALPELARIAIQDSLRRWEPRVEVVEVTAAPIQKGMENQISLSLVYRFSGAKAESISLTV